MRLATLPTPLDWLERFSAAVGRKIWIKRDDLTGLAFGGNKVRKLEFSLGAGQCKGTDTVVSVEAAQSNHARSVAAAARVLGWECHLVLGGTRPERPTGNLALDSALGAHLHFVGSDDWSELEAQATALVGRLSDAGARPLFIPMGGSTAIGALGFVAAYLEVLGQCAERDLRPECIVLATSTGGTQSGPEFARAILGHGPCVVGVGVAKGNSDLTRDVLALQSDIAALLSITMCGAPRATILDGYLGTGYAAPTVDAKEAFDLLARTDAVFTDPVYPAKAVHAVVDLARQHPSGGPVIFWHTGGQPALFSYSAGITRWADDPVFRGDQLQ